MPKRSANDALGLVRAASAAPPLMKRMTAGSESSPTRRSTSSTVIGRRVSRSVSTARCARPRRQSARPSAALPVPALMAQMPVAHAHLFDSDEEKWRRDERRRARRSAALRALRGGSGGRRGGRRAPCPTSARRRSSRAACARAPRRASATPSRRSTIGTIASGSPRCAVCSTRRLELGAERLEDAADHDLLLGRQRAARAERDGVDRGDARRRDRPREPSRRRDARRAPR